ncbi:hypothetical protein HDE_00449 [Halotydeus destructor]|nr:hypothetical protein HDE_00449 [Halotydeus destructor]
MIDAKLYAPVPVNNSMVLSSDFLVFCNCQITLGQAKQFVAELFRVEVEKKRELNVVEIYVRQREGCDVAERLVVSVDSHNASYALFVAITVLFGQAEIDGSMFPLRDAAFSKYSIATKKLLKYWWSLQPVKG